jgi:DtxR family Mn-dependent transcriptional regulator
MQTLFTILILAAAASLLWPRRGLLARWRETLRLEERSRREDALKHILKREANGETPTLEGIAGALQISTNTAAALLGELELGGLISYDEGAPRLRPPGRELAVHVVRAHRLWESYLADATGVAEAEWHGLAERQEHLLSQQQAKELAAQLGHPTHDPHGDAIPDEQGDLNADAGQPLNKVPLHSPVLLTHIEDEPDAIYAQLAAQGLRPGMKAVVVEKSPHGIRFRADGAEHVLSPLHANNVFCAPLPEVSVEQLFAEEYLAGLKRGERARVVGLTPACRGAERRRLLDLGFVPGSVIEVDMASPMGDPVAYRVRGATIALRREQAGLVRIARQQELAA